MDEASAHEQMWHEDDVLHQAEGVLAARFDITVDRARAAMDAHAETEGTTSRDVAARVIERHVRLVP